MRTIKELQEDRIEFSLDCFDRIYLNLYIPILCSLGGIAFFIRNILDWSVPIPAAFKEYRDLFVNDVYEFAEDNGLEVYKFDKKEQNSKEEIARQHLEANVTIRKELRSSPIKSRQINWRNWSENGWTGSLHL